MKREKMVPHSFDEVHLKREFHEINNFLPMISKYLPLVNEKFYALCTALKLQILQIPHSDPRQVPGVAIFNIKKPLENRLSCSQ
jgi:hypothetical protein